MSFTITEMPASTSNSPAGSMDGDANSTQGIPMARMTTGSSRGRSSQRMLSLESTFVAEPDELLSSRTNSPHLNTHVSIQTPNIEYKSTWRKAKAHIAHQHHALKGRRSDVRLRTAVAFMRRGADKNLANESTEGWMKTSKILQMHDETKIQGCKEDVDTLLVIAGLFSAVLTGFIVELFKTLQEDNDDQILAMLTQISHQLSGFQVLEGRINSTIPFTSNPPSTFQKSPLNVRVNILWFMSLTFSLITASLGMLVKQWLREYLSNNSLSPRTHVRTRHYRHIGVKKYRVFEIASFLPLLLQISLILFLIGLSDFLSALNTAVGRVVSALVFTWLALYCTTAIAPILSAQTPWKTPFLMRPLTIARNWLRLVGALTVLVFRHAWDKEDSSTSTSHPKEGLWLQEMTKTLSNLRERAKETCVRLRSVCSSFVVTLRRLDPTRSLPQPFLQHLRNLWYEFNVGDENLIRKDQRLDVASLVAADAIFRDDDFIDTLVQCSTDLPLAETIALARQIVRHRHDGVHSPALGVKPLTEDEDFIPQLRYWEGLRGSGPAISESALNKLRLCVLNAAQSHIEETQTVVENYTFLPPWRSNQMLEDLSRAIPFILSPTTLPFDSSKKVGTLFSKMFELDRKVACQALASFCTYLSINTRHGTTYENTRISTATGLDNLIFATHALLDQLDWTEEHVDEQDHHGQHVPPASSTPPPGTPTNKNPIVTIRGIPTNPDSRPRPSLICASFLTLLVKFEGDTSILIRNAQKIKEMQNRFALAMRKEHEKFKGFVLPQGRGFFYHYLFLSNLKKMHISLVHQGLFEEVSKADKDWMDLVMIVKSKES